MFDLRLREKIVQQLEAENAALAAKVVVTPEPENAAVVPPATFPQGQTHSQPDAVEAGSPAIQKTALDTPATMTQRSEGCPTAPSRDGESDRSDVRPESQTTTVEKSRSAEVGTSSTRGVLRGIDTHNQSHKREGQGRIEGGKHRAGRETLRRDSKTTRTAATPAIAVSVPLTRKKLTPPAAVVPGRVSVISFPRCGSRVTLATPAAKNPLKQADGDGEIAEEADSVASDLATRNQDRSPTGTAQYSESEHTASYTALSRRRNDHRTVGLTPAPPLPRRPSVEPAACVSPKATPTTNDVSSTSVGVADVDLALEHGDPDVVANEGRDGGSTGLVRRTKGQERGNSGIAGWGGTPARSTDNVFRSNGQGEGGGDGGEQGGRGANAAPLAGIEDFPREHGGVNAEFVVPAGQEEGEVSSVFISRLVEGVPVLKHGGRGKPKPKLLWATPDLSEIFYTNVGR